MVEKNISQAVIRRLPRYYRYLGQLLEEDVEVERISSHELSQMMKVTASQIRQDLNNFGGFGQQGYGYNVKFLYTEIGKILGLEQNHNVIIIGSGHLGQALANYKSFGKRGFTFTAMFDKDPKVVGTKVGDITIKAMDDLGAFLKENQVDIATLAIPKDAAEEVADLLVENGVKAIWNFAHLDLEVPRDVIVENVHLSESLMRLSYDLNQNKGEYKKDAYKSR
ncbi:MAG: redox-sensing transcriptional repressor Rex [Lachnospiraceae bacterium]|nr:redox-sensing transcriptional repressor Rex [Lachnospiraceae bacterium]